MADFLDYMIQHALYVKGLEKNIQHETVCFHKQPDECAFGKKFYTTLKPNIHGYPEAQRQLLEQVERVHIQFHEAAKHIRPDELGSEPSQQEARRYSAQLIELLDRLEKLSIGINDSGSQGWFDSRDGCKTS